MAWAGGHAGKPRAGAGEGRLVPNRGQCLTRAPAAGVVGGKANVSPERGQRLPYPVVSHRPAVGRKAIHTAPSVTTRAMC